MPAAVLAAALVAGGPALAALAAAGPVAAPGPADTSRAEGQVRDAQLDLRQAEQQLRAATGQAQRISSQIVRLSAQQAQTAVTLAQARTAARAAVQAAYNDALIDPTANLLAALSGGDPDLADHVRQRKLIAAGARARELAAESTRLAELGTRLAAQRRSAVRAAAEAVGVAAQAQQELAAAQRSERRVRAAAALAAQQRELAKLNEDLLISLEAAYDPAAGRSSGGQMAPDSPADLLALYQRAATTCPGLPWGVLAAIGQVETDHGRNKAVSSAGAMGPMQFLPSSWAAYGGRR